MAVNVTFVVLYSAVMHAVVQLRERVAPTCYAVSQLACHAAVMLHSRAPPKTNFQFLSSLFQYNDMNASLRIAANQ